MQGLCIQPNSCQGINQNTQIPIDNSFANNNNLNGRTSNAVISNVVEGIQNPIMNFMEFSSDSTSNLSQVYNQENSRCGSKFQSFPNLDSRETPDANEINTQIEFPFLNNHGPKNQRFSEYYQNNNEESANGKFMPETGDNIPGQLSHNFQDSTSGFSSCSFSKYPRSSLNTARSLDETPFESNDVSAPESMTYDCAMNNDRTKDQRFFPDTTGVSLLSLQSDCPFNNNSFVSSPNASFGSKQNEIIINATHLTETNNIDIPYIDHFPGDEDISANY